MLCAYFSFSKTRSLCPLLLLWIYFMLHSCASKQHSCVNIFNYVVTHHGKKVKTMLE
jgi:hypothetical protein